MKPLIATAQEAQALNNGTKTAHLFLMEPQPDYAFGGKEFYADCVIYGENTSREIKPPFEKGDELFVQEPWFNDDEIHSFTKLHYEGNHKPSDGDFVWREAGSMPEWASRTRLRVTEVPRAVRAQDMNLTMLKQCGEGKQLPRWIEWLNENFNGAYDKNEWLLFVTFERTTK